MDKPQTASFIGKRWHGEASLSRLYCRDMLIVGSVINLLTGFVALMIAAQGGNLGVAAIVHFLCLPYNVFLVLALWRTPRCSRFMAWTSLIWLGTVTVI